MDEQHRRDAVQAVNLLPVGWTLTRCVQFVADHVKRTTQVLSIEEALDRFLKTKEKTSDYHSNDLARRLKRWAETTDRTQPIHAVTKQEIESYLAVLGGLVGLRPYEVLRLEWTGIHFETREIRVEPGWTKTHRARVIPLQPNALEWLSLVAAHTVERTGRVMPSASTWNNRWRRWRLEEDTPLPLPWWVGKDDVLRHSYGTYRAAILRNSHNLAEEMGNSVVNVRTYYDAVVSPSVARLWWKIRPE